MFKRLLKNLKQKYSKNESVYFVTFHKTASSYFSNYILKQIIGLNHNDLASCIFQNQTIENIDFEAPNTIYGPIRLSLDEGPVYEKLIEPILKQNILGNHKVICFIRDPRDIIVSFYYSQAYSHSLSTNNAIKTLQLKNREYALEIGIDQYALEKADFLKEKFDILIQILKYNNNTLLLKYEEMVYDFDNFYDKINHFIQLPPESKEVIYKNTRPTNKGIHDHRRNGEQGGYKNELQQETIERINEKLQTTLDFFEYK